jgi:hypothetical protein
MDETHSYNFKDAQRFDRELEELKHKKMVRAGKNLSLLRNIIVFRTCSSPS